MLHFAPQSRRLLSVAAIAATAATIVFGVYPHSQASRPVSLAAPVLPAVSTFGVVWAHDDSVPNTADTLSHERLADEAPAPTF